MKKNKIKPHSVNRPYRKKLKYTEKGNAAGVETIINKKQSNKGKPLEFIKITLCEKKLEVPKDFLNKNLAPLGIKGLDLLPFHQRKAYMNALQEYIRFWQLVDRDVKDVEWCRRSRHNSQCQADAIMMGLMETIEENENKAANNTTD